MVSASFRRCFSSVGTLTIRSLGLNTPKLQAHIDYRLHLQPSRQLFSQHYRPPPQQDRHQHHPRMRCIHLGKAAGVQACHSRCARTSAFSIGSIDGRGLFHAFLPQLVYHLATDLYPPITASPWLKKRLIALAWSTLLTQRNHLNVPDSPKLEKAPAPPPWHGSSESFAAKPVLEKAASGRIIRAVTSPLS